MGRVLVIDDNDTMREGMAVTLKKAGHDVVAFRSGIEALATYKKRAFDVVVTDLKMEAMDGIEVVQRLRAVDSAAVVMVVTAFGTVETAVRAMQEGACDFITKPFSPEVLRAKVDALLDVAKTRAHVRVLEARNQALNADVVQHLGTALVGDSSAVAVLRSQIAKAAPTDATVFIQGESGTGKELVARMLHEQSSRAAGPFIVTHCAALAETLLESELFGHERGAFTGAVKRKLGRFELADGGTIFLDEIGELSPAVQTKLLRVLQERELQRVGGEDTVRVNVRVISATHRNLQALVADGRFREDLYYRLHIVPLQVPALRERLDDLPTLANHFVRKHRVAAGSRATEITPAALAALARHSWPGNVRELENAIEQSLVFAEGDCIDLDDLPAFFRGAALAASPQTPTPNGSVSLSELVDAYERALIEKAYQKAGGVKAEAARLLGVKTSALYYKLEKYGFIQKAAPESSDGSTAPIQSTE